MKKRIAVLDLGTNTFHLLIADAENGKIAAQLVAETRAVKLGEGGISKGYIAEAAFSRGIETLRFFKSLIDQYAAEEIHAAGTSALRSASNGQDFIRETELQTGIKISLIDGAREAELIYKGVCQAVELTKPALIMDIGGGSVEFIFCDEHEVFHKKSYPIGAARLMDKFHHSDPVSEEDVQAIFHYLDEQLGDLKENARKFQPAILIGSAGAFETFTELTTKMSGTSPITGSTSFFFTQDQLLSVLLGIILSTHEERAANESITPVRVDMIVVASILTSYIIRELQIKEIAMSAYSLKEGLLYERAL